MRLTDRRRQIVELFDQVSMPIDLDEVWWKAGEFGIKVNRSSMHRLANHLVFVGVLHVVRSDQNDRRIRFATPLKAQVELVTPESEPRVLDDPLLIETLVEVLSRQGLVLDGRKITVSLA